MEPKIANLLPIVSELLKQCHWRQAVKNANPPQRKCKCRAIRISNNSTCVKEQSISAALGQINKSLMGPVDVVDLWS